MKHPFRTTDVFTREQFGGNPLAVFPDGTGIDGETMQRIAVEFNLSETVFVLPPDDPAHAARLRIFTPQRELPFAGHPTVGTALVLAWIGAIPMTGDATDVVLEEGAGPIDVRITNRDGRPDFARFTSPALPASGEDAPPAGAIAEFLSLAPGDVRTDPAPRAFSCGLPFLFVALESRDAVARARLDSGAWDRHMGDHWADGVFLFSFDDGDGSVDIHGRMFGGSLGVAEDPATGSSAAAIAGYLSPLEPERTGTLRWVIEQGRDMGRPSRIYVEADHADGEIAAVRVGGSAVPVMSGKLDLAAG